MNDITDLNVPLGGLSEATTHASPYPTARDCTDLRAPSGGLCRVTTHRVTVFRCLYNIFVCLIMAAAILPWRDGYSPMMSHISGRLQVRWADFVPVSWFAVSFMLYCLPAML